MPLSSTSVSLAQRIGLWALVQALPDENTVRRYLKTAYLGLSGIIIGSVLTGSALAAGLIAIYRILIENGMTPGMGLLLTTAASIVVIVCCFALAARWFTRLAEIKNELSISDGLGMGVIGSAINTLAEGFIEGLVLSKQEVAAANKAEEAKAEEAVQAQHVNPRAERETEFPEPEYKPEIYGEHGHA